MKAFFKEILRWCVIVAFGSYGAWQLIDAVWRIATLWEGGWFDVFILLILPILLAAPFLAVAYFCLRRQYRKLFYVLGAVGAVIAFGLLSMLPNDLGLYELMQRYIDKNHSLVFLALPLTLLFLLGPIYIAAWFFRFCERLARPKQSGPEEKAKTQATY